MERTLAQCRINKWFVQKVEHWIPQANKRRDLFGVIDVIALDRKKGPLGIQVCGEDVSPHRKKIAESVEAGAWLKCGGRLEIWAWRHRKRRLKSGNYSKRTHLELRVFEITLDDLDPATLDRLRDWEALTEERPCYDLSSVPF